MGALLEDKLILRRCEISGNIHIQKTELAGFHQHGRLQQHG